MKTNTLLYATIIVLALCATYVWLPKSTPNEPPLPEAFHIHADIKVFLDTETTLDLSQEKYQSDESTHLHDHMHLHDGNGDVLHMHKAGITLGDFFASLGILLTDTCLTLDTGESYCTDTHNLLALYVNGTQQPSIADFVFDDLDQVLLYYGPVDDARALLDTLTDDACIYSEKCPERGTPPTENCVGGLGTTCS